jgi:hypothetical protein
MPYRSEIEVVLLLDRGVQSLITRGAARIVRIIPANVDVRLANIFVPTPIIESRSGMGVIARGWDELAHLVIVPNRSLASFAVEIAVVPVDSGLVKGPWSA